VRRKAPASLDAYDLYLIGVEGKALRTKQSVETGLAALDKAIALDPGFARAYVARGWLHFFTTDFGVPFDEGLKRMEADMRKGFELDPRDADARAALAVYYSLINKLPESESLIREALELNPNSVHVMLVAAVTLPYLGFPEEAAALSDRAMRLDPRMVPVNLFAISDSYFWVRRIPPESRSSGRNFELAASYAFLGRAEDSTSARAALLAQRPDITAQAYYAEGWYFARKQEEDLFFDSFRILNLPMCATSEQLKWIGSPKPLPECPAQTN
jgi:tetratricopeptide (TPR) repeat protein